MHSASLIITAALLSTPLHAQTCGELTALGSLGGSESQALDVTPDGDVVVGVAELTSGHSHAFRWTAAGGMQDLGTFGGYPDSEARGVSADGSVVVGNLGQLEGFRWTAAGGWQGFGGPAPFSAHDVSADGAVIVGRAASLSSDDVVACLVAWPNVQQRHLLGTLGGAHSSAEAISADGSVVVGWAENATTDRRAFRWTAAGGMQDLGPGTAVSVNTDGSVVIGITGSDAFRWTAAGGMQSLGMLPGDGFAWARDVNFDGSVIVGESVGQRATAFLWTAAEGMRRLGPITNPGVAYGVSDDGSVVVGWARFVGGPPGSTRGFRVRSSALGETYCRPTVENSTGCGGIVLANGDPRLAMGSLELTAASLPQNSFGFFLTSQAQDNVTNAGGSQGTLCLGGSIGRFVGSGQVMDSGPSGSFTLTVNLNAVPAPTITGSTAIQPGETWNFQCWHRDVNPTATSNFTDAVSITFE